MSGPRCWPMVPTVLDVLRPAFDWQALMAMPASELDRIRTVPGVLAPVHVAAGHQCLVLTGNRFDLVAAGLVDADEPWPGDPGIGSAPRWVKRADGRRCALSYLARRKHGECRLVLGRTESETER
jgi:hypothetical protein